MEFDELQASGFWSYTCNPTAKGVTPPIIMMLVMRSNAVLQATIGLSHDRCPTHNFKVPHHDYSTIERKDLRWPLGQLPVIALHGVS
jgi:hypothetical protein